MLLIIAIDKTFQSAKTQKDFAQFEFEICLAGIGYAFLQQRTIVVQKCLEKTHRLNFFAKECIKLSYFRAVQCEESKNTHFQ